MRNSILVYLSFFYFQICGCQESDNLKPILHFVISPSDDVLTYPYKNSLEGAENTPHYYIIVLTLESDSLVVVDSLNYNKENNELKRMFHFDNEKWFLLIEQEKAIGDKFYKSEWLTYYSIFDYSDQDLKLKTINSGNLKLGRESNSRRFFINNKIHQAIADSKSSTLRIYNTLNKNGEIVEIHEPWEYNRYYVKNESGLILRYFNGLNYSFGKDGRIKIGFNNKEFDKWKDFDIGLPKSTQDGKLYKSFKIQYTLPTSNYLIGYKQNTVSGIITPNLQHILNKNTGVWDSFLLPRYYSTYNCYKDEYLYGTAIDTGFHIFGGPDKNKIYTQIEISKEKYTDKYGPIPNILVTSGKFFIYHIPTKTFTEFVAKDRDTEVIQVIDDWIYYRVYDEIRKMKLDKVKHSFDLKTDESVVKDKDKVPHIHHIFMHKKSVVKKEELYKK